MNKKDRRSLTATLIIVAFVLLAFPAKSYAADFVTLNKPHLPCGAQDMKVSGNSSFDPDDSFLIVLVDNPGNVYVIERSGRWKVPKYRFEIGPHQVVTGLVTRNCVGPGCVVDIDTWGFDVSGGCKNKISSDTRCLSPKPPLPTWSSFDVNTKVLNWSAVGGNKVEIKFSGDPKNLEYTVTTSNDGHEKTGAGTTMGWFGGYWQMRTINGCEKGAWSPVYHL